MSFSLIYEYIHHRADVSLRKLKRIIIICMTMGVCPEEREMEIQ